VIVLMLAALGGWIAYNLSRKGAKMPSTIK
jgi:hypothetical protein